MGRSGGCAERRSHLEGALRFGYFNQLQHPKPWTDDDPDYDLTICKKAPSIFFPLA